MYANACGMANAQPVKYCTAAGIKIFNTSMTKYFLLQQLPYFITFFMAPVTTSCMLRGWNALRVWGLVNKNCRGLFAAT